MRELLQAIRIGKGQDFTKVINAGFKVDNKAMVRELQNIQEESKAECFKVNKFKNECDGLDKEFLATIDYLKELNKKASQANGHREMLYYLAIYQNYIVKYRILPKHYRVCNTPKEKECHERNSILTNFFFTAEDVSKLAYDQIKNTKTSLDSEALEEAVKGYEN